MKTTHAIALTLALASLVTRGDANDAYAIVDEANSSGFAKKTFGPYTTYVFASGGAIAFSQAGKADVLLVGGGGGGGMTMGGGGGGGGVRELTDHVFPASQTFPVTIGEGGAGATSENANGGNGGVSSLGDLAVYGGGGGASWAVRIGSSSATGGGNAQGTQTPAEALPDMFFTGGASYASVAGGGGGAGAAGGYLSAETAEENDEGKSGPGGDGVASAITGSVVVYGGGGGGGAGGVGKGFLEERGVTASLGGDGGAGGGGRGADENSGLPGSNGVDGLGGGGGGGGYEPTTYGGRGGNGIVVVRTTDPDYAGADVAVDIESVIADSPTGATVSWCVGYFAAAQPTAIRFEYGTASNALDKVFSLSSVASAAGAGSESLTNLFAEATTYYGRMAIWDEDGQDWIAGQTIAMFKTGSYGSRPSRAAITGLWQRYIANKWDVSTPVLADGEPSSDNARFLSPAAAYINDGTHWTGLKPDGSLSECWWGNNQTYAYVGYMYFEDATYTFGGCIDDTSLVRIDGVEVVRADGYSANLALGTWTPSRGEGWYPVEIRVGNGSGEYGPIAGFGGLGYNTSGYTAKDTSAVWKSIVDPGDGTLLRVEAEEALEIVGSRIGGAVGSRKLFADIAAVPDIAGATLYIAFPSAPAGYDATACEWTAVGTVAAGTQQVDVALPAGAKYAVYSAVSGDDRLWTRFLSLDYVDTVADGLPVARLGEVAVSSVGALTAALSVRDLGGAESVQVTFSALNAENGRAVDTVFDNVTVGTRTFAIDGLVPDRRIVVTATVSNGNGSVLADGSAEVSFSLPQATGATFYKAGLLQAKTGGWNASTAESNFENSVIPVEVVPGTVMADVQADEGNYQSEGHFYVNPATGTTNFWNNKNTTWSYKGEIYLEAQKTYAFGKYLDDGAVLYVDGVKIIENGNYKDFAKATFTTAQTGWHSFLAYVYDGSGGKGPTGGDWGPQMGLAWNDTGLLDGKPSVSGWKTIRDPGDMSVLRAPFDFVAVTVASATPTANGYDATVSIGEGNRRGTPDLYACYGETCGGSDTSLWSHVVLVQSGIGDTVSSVQYSGFSGTAVGEEVRYLRFRLVAEDGVDSWSECLYVAPRTGPILMPGVTIDASSGITARFVGGLIQTGSGATAEVVLEIGTEEDLSDARQISFGQKPAGVPFTNDVAVVAGTNYFWRLKAIASDDDYDMTRTASFLVPSAAAFDGALSVASSANRVTFTGIVIDLGAGGATTVKLLGGTSADSLEQVGNSVVKTETGTISFVVDVPFLDGTYYAKAVAENVVGETTFIAETPIATVTLVDNTTYTWKEGVTEGAWTNANNWIPSVNNPYALYPNSSKARANFKNCTVPTVVTIAGQVQVDVIQNEGNHTLDLTFRKDPAAETARIQCWATWWDGFGDSRVTIDGVYYYCHDGKYMNLSYLGVVNGATFETAQETQWHKGGAVLEVSNGSLWLQSDWTLSMTGNGSKFILDNSTIRQAKGGSIYCPRNNAGANNVIEVRGTNPVFDCEGIVSGRDSQGESRPTLLFVVPEDGYVTAPFSRANGGNFQSGALPMNLVVDPSSPALKSGRKHVTTKLVDYPRGVIHSEGISFAAQPHPEKQTFRYTYGANYAAEPANEGDRPTALWLDVPVRGLIIMLQ